MAGGLDANHLVPMRVVITGFDGLFVVTPAEAMHGTVEIDAWEALAMGVQDIFDVSGVGDIGSTLVVYDDVKVLIPVRIFVGSEDRLGLFVGESLVVDIDEIDGHDGVKTRLNAVLKDVFLREVIVAATAGDN
jgi:hypothetical protein